MNADHDLFLVLAGAVAGVTGAAGGITSLISYPALVAVGIAPLSANVTNAVALVASLPGSALGSRRELAGQFRWIRHWAWLAITGGATGVALLLLTPDGVFGHLVPFLLALAAIVLLAQPVISRWRERHARRERHVLLPLGLFAVSVYSGYFGAGSGVMVLALLLITVDQNLPRANALKNVLLGVADVVAAVGFLFFGPVHLGAAAALASGLLVGSFVGPVVTRHVPSGLLRVVVGLMGLGLAAAIWAGQL